MFPGDHTGHAPQRGLRRIEGFGCGKDRLCSPSHQPQPRRPLGKRFDQRLYQIERRRTNQPLTDVQHAGRTLFKTCGIQTPQMNHAAQIVEVVSKRLVQQALVVAGFDGTNHKVVLAVGGEMFAGADQDATVSTRSPLVRQLGSDTAVIAQDQPRTGFDNHRRIVAAACLRTPIQPIEPLFDVPLHLAHQDLATDSPQFQTVDLGDQVPLRIHQPDLGNHALARYRRSRRDADMTPDRRSCLLIHAERFQAQRQQRSVRFRFRQGRR